MLVFGGVPAPMKAEVDKEEKLSTSELLHRVKTVLGERCNETHRVFVGSPGCWNLPPLVVPPLLLPSSKGG